ncbi:ABC transporter ATP-binding protein [Paenibacillus glycanilyticus]|uniref:ABC transporter ATP-binding protein n=1 Tax=Paenibacillus glycanilyticus TaxID=126569 RepID=UPI003EBBDE9B
MNENAISLKEVELQRTHFQLGPIQLEVPKGYVTAIVGPNGSGKSSTFKLILDLIKPQKGDIKLLGKNISEDEDWQTKSRVGFLPELFSPHDNRLKASAKTEFVKKWYPEWDVNRYQELLRLFEVDDGIKLGKMSKGMRRKYEFALILSHHPELLLLDEPSSGLDPLAWRTMIDVLHRYMEPGDRTILMASHIVEEVKRLADYIVFMIHGRVLGVYEKDELFGSWHAFYVHGEQVNRKRVQAMPGQCGIEDTGGGMLRVITRMAPDAEDWCGQENITITHRQALQLDDILAILVEQERTRLRA